MKPYLSLIVLLFSALSMAQSPVEKSVGDFTELKVYDLIHVELIKSNENKVIITGDNSDAVIINNKSGKLKIKMKLEEIFDGSQTKVALYYKAIDVIDVNEGSKVKSKDIIKQFEIDLKAQEGASIHVPVDVSYANIKAVTGGIVEVEGKAKAQDVSIYTGGTYKGEDLITGKTEVAIKAAGEAHVNAKTLVEIKIRAGGDVYVYGSPEEINEDKVFGGRVEQVN